MSQRETKQIVRENFIPIFLMFTVFSIVFVVTKQISESFFLSLPTLSLVYFFQKKEVWRQNKNKTMFFTLPVFGVILALQGFILPGCQILWIEVFWGGWFFLGLASFIWLIMVGVEFLSSRLPKVPYPRIGRILKILAVILLGIPFFMTVLSVHRVKYANLYNPLQAFSLSYEKISLQTVDGLTLSAWYVPAPKSKESVLICHGLGANKSNFISSIEFLVKAGFNVLIFDFRGHGESDGHTCSIGYWEKYDVRAAYKFLQSKEHKVYGLGFSMGAASLLHFASTQAKFEAIILDSPFDSLSLVAQDHLFFFPPFLRPLSVQLMFFYARVFNQAKPSQIDNKKWLSQIEAPTLIFHGEVDSVISEKRSRALSGKNVRRIVAPGKDHVESLLSGDPHYQRLAIDFFQKKN